MTAASSIERGGRHGRARASPSLTLVGGAAMVKETGSLRDEPWSANRDARGGWMVQFGQELRREREVRGVSVDAVCAATKVSQRHVEALEEGRLQELPGGVFRKGIVRSYLSAVGLDEAVWMPRFELTLREIGAAPTEEQDWVEFAENVRKNRHHEGPPTGMRWLGVLLMLLVLLVCGWLSWKYVLRDRLSGNTHAGLPGGTHSSLPPVQTLVP